MQKLFVVAVMVGAGISACVGGSGDPCIASGTVIAVARTNGSGSCPADVVSGVMLVTQMVTLGKGAACGMDHFSLTLDFTDQSGSGSPCAGSDALSLPDIGSDGGAGTDTMAITCANGTSCTETFAVTFTPQ